MTDRSASNTLIQREREKERKRDREWKKRYHTESVNWRNRQTENCSLNVLRYTAFIYSLRSRQILTAKTSMYV